jgi:hypothetical protein
VRVPLRRTIRLGSHTGAIVAIWLSGTRVPLVSDVMYAPAMSSNRRRLSSPSRKTMSTARLPSQNVDTGAPSKPAASCREIAALVTPTRLAAS